MSAICALFVLATGTVATPPSGPDGLFCAEKKVSLIIVTKTAHIAAKLHPGNNTFGFKGLVDGYEVKPCAGNRYTTKPKGRQNVIFLEYREDENDQHQHCVSSLLQEHDVSLAPRGKSFTYMGSKMKPQFSWDPTRPDQIVGKISGVPLLGAIDIIMDKASCKRFTKVWKEKSGGGLGQKNEKAEKYKREGAGKSDQGEKRHEL